KQHVYSLVDNQQHVMQIEPVQEEIVGSARRAIWVLQAAVGFVLLIACANLANLLLARAETRHREFAVRTALGAGRRRLLWQFLTEGTLLALLGGVTGLALAWLGVRALMRLYPDSLPRSVDVAVDPAVLAFTLVVSLATGLVFGLAPLMHIRTGALTQALKEGGARGSTGARHHVRRALVMAEVALAVILVVGAGLMLRTVLNLTNVDAGFNRSQLVTFALDLPAANYPKFDDVAQFYRRLLAELSSIPGVQRASAMSGLPPQRRVDANDTDIDNYTAPKEGPYENVDYWNFVTADYFETMGIPLVEGRGYQAGDADGGLVAVVNQTLVDTFWKGQNPIGQRLRPCCGDQIPWMTVVGVAKDVKQGGVDQKTGTELYYLIDQLPRIFPNTPGTAGGTAGLNIVLRTTLPVESMQQTIEARVRAADASLPVIRFQAMDEVFARSLSRPRLLAHLLAAFAGTALLLAAVGTYGVLSYMVTERRREIGIRMALGAQQSSVLAIVMRQGLMLTGIGLAVGIAGAFALTQLMASLLFGVAPSDPVTLVGVAVSITAVAILACYVPAHRAARVDPIVVLREE
ncbi:MAG: ABC transporter permease, partial [Acidobacteria bacterium]|nr:ABC transporter permease [Acidobacteriota bacterium]